MELAGLHDEVRGLAHQQAERAPGQPRAVPAARIGYQAGLAAGGRLQVEAPDPVQVGAGKVSRPRIERTAEGNSAVARSTKARFGSTTATVIHLWPSADTFSR
jgi:hypothetical protein